MGYDVICNDARHARCGNGQCQRGMLQRSDTVCTLITQHSDSNAYLIQALVKCFTLDFISTLLFSTLLELDLDKITTSNEVYANLHYASTQDAISRIQESKINQKLSAIFNPYPHNKSSQESCLPSLVRPSLPPSNEQISLTRELRFLLHLALSMILSFRMSTSTAPYPRHYPQPIPFHPTSPSTPTLTNASTSPSPSPSQIHIHPRH